MKSSDSGTTDLSAPIATSLLFENENCRIWLLDIEPDGATPWHRHDSNYRYVVTKAAAVHCEYLDERPPDYQNEDVGDSGYHLTDSGHRLVNDSSSSYQNVVIEFLNTESQ